MSSGLGSSRSSRLPAQHPLPGPGSHHATTSRRRPLTVRVAASNRRSAGSGSRGAKRLAITMPGSDPTSSEFQQGHVDHAGYQVTQPGHQGERHGMGDIGCGDPDNRQFGIKQDQRGDAERSGADRGDRHQRAQHEPVRTVNRSGDARQDADAAGIAASNRGGISARTRWPKGPPPAAG